MQGGAEDSYIESETLGKGPGTDIKATMPISDLHKYKSEEQLADL